MPQFVDAVVCGIQVKHMILMNSKFPGFDVHAKEKFPAGTQIAFKAEKDLTPEQIETIFTNGFRGSLAVQYPLKSPASSKKSATFTPSPYQEKILDTVLNTDKHIFIEALAGSGKTSTLVWILQEMFKCGATKNQNIIYLAFNKSIQEELSTKLQGTGVPALTTHGFGFSKVLKKKFPNIQVDQQVIPNAFVQTLLADQGWGDTAEKRKDAKKLPIYAFRKLVYELIGYIKSWAICPTWDNKQGWTFDKNQKEAIANFIGIYEMELPNDFTLDELVDRACRVIANQLPEPGQVVHACNYDDMLYLPLVLNLEFPKYDIVLTDESQDFNTCQIIFLEKMIRS